MDRCVFSMTRNGRRIALVLYVDDILVLTSDEDNKKWIETVLKDKCKEHSVEHCDENGLSYLGMHRMENAGDDIMISMDGYIDEILKEYQEMSTIHEYVVPTEASLFDHDNNTEKMKDSSFFHRMVAKLLYLSKQA